MTKIVQTGNLNLCPQYYYLDEEKLLARQMDFYDNFSASIDFAVENKADFFLITSNFFDTPKPNPKQLSKINTQLRRLNEIDCETVICSGPCDVSKDDSLYSWETFTDQAGISIFTQDRLTSLEYNRNDQKTVFIGKNHVHKGEGTVLDLDTIDKKAFNVLVIESECIRKEAGREVFYGRTREELYSGGVNLISTAGKEAVETNGKCTLVASPGVEKVSFDEIDHEKGFHLITVDENKKIDVVFKSLHCRPMEIVKLDLSLSTSSIINEIKKRIKRGRKEKILKLSLSGKVLFEIYKNYDRLEVENLLGNRFFYHVIENEIQIEDLQIDEFDDIRIFSVEKEFSNLLDKKIDYYKKKKDSDYSKFYKNVRKLGLKYLKN